MRTIDEERAMLRGLLAARVRQWDDKRVAAFTAAIRYCRQRIAALETR
jgi:hypothetical protein